MAHDYSDQVLLAALRDAAQQAQQSVNQSRAIVRETHELLRLARRIEAPLIEGR